MIRFDVVGVPVQQGSKRHIGGGRMIESAGTRHRDWRHAVATEARAVAAGIPDAPLDGPLCLSVQFPPLRRDFPPRLWSNATSSPVT